MKPRLYSMLALTAVVGLLATGCGSDDSSSDSSNGSSDAASADWLAEAQQASEEATSIPTEINAAELGEVEPPKDLSLYFIACDQSIPGCVAQVEGFEQASKLLGYETKVCDAKFDVAAFQNCMSQAVEAKPDAIVNNARPQSDAPEAYAKAHDAGIPVIGQFTSERPNPETGNAAEVGFVCEDEGEMLGNHIVAQSEGKADVIVFADTVYRCNGQRADGVRKAVERCPDCSVKVERFSAGTAQTDLPPAMQAAIQSNPNVNWIVGTPGFAGTVAADAIRQAGLQDKISVGTFDGDQPELSLLRKDDIVKADVVSGVYENGWTVVDTIARLLSGGSVPDNISNPTTVLYTNANVPPKGTYEGAEGFRDQFAELWGAN